MALRPRQRAGARDLKYKLDVNDPEEKAEFIPAIRAERVAGEEL